MPRGRPKQVKQTQDIKPGGKCPNCGVGTLTLKVIDSQLNPEKVCTCSKCQAWFPYVEVVTKEDQIKKLEAQIASLKSTP